jgi:hypothetical protein
MEDSKKKTDPAAKTSTLIEEIKEEAGFKLADVDEEVQEKLDLFEQRLKQVNKDLSRLEPVRKALFMG